MKNDFNNHSILNGLLLLQGEECVITTVLEQYHLLKKITVGVLRKLPGEGRRDGKGGRRRDGKERGRRGDSNRSKHLHVLKHVALLESSSCNTKFAAISVTIKNLGKAGRG